MLSERLGSSRSRGTCRIGTDVSILLRLGYRIKAENHELYLLFFHLVSVSVLEPPDNQVNLTDATAKLPIIPFFIFDGRERPTSEGEIFLSFFRITEFRYLTSPERRQRGT